MRPLRWWLVTLHRWIGLAAFPVLAVAGATGALLLWPGPGPLGSIVGRLHESLALGRIGVWIVVAASAAAVILQLTGLVLWWKTRTIRIRLRSGWWRAVTDLHYSVGALGFAIMIVLAVTAVGLPFIGPDYPTLRPWLMQYHTGFKFPLFVKVLYWLASAAFAVQGFTGLVMWWKPRLRDRAARDAR